MTPEKTNNDEHYEDHIDIDDEFVESKQDSVEKKTKNNKEVKNNLNS